jgi:maleylacetate reductase
VNRFAYQLRPVRILFGSGAVNDLGAELSRNGRSLALLVSTPGRKEVVGRLASLLDDAVVARITNAALHVPQPVVTAALDAIDRTGPDCVVSVGGGSAIGLGKALAIARGLLHIAVPTTYSGSEMTDIWGITDARAKTTGRSPQAGPSTVIYDPDLTLSLPTAVSAASGMNGVAHAVEALYAPDRHPVASLLAEESIRIFAEALPAILASPRDGDARADALRAAHFAGLALNHTTMGLHHKLCHVLGGAFGMPHAATHAALLPHVVAFNRDAAPAAMHVIAGVLDAGDAAEGLHALNRRLGVVMSLRELGLRREDIDEAAGAAMRSAYPNPRTVDGDDLRRLLADAWEGRAPR